MSCQHECERPPEFPKPIVNRPGLPSIDYRIGSYGDMRAHMLARLDQALAVARWTHRGSDDPGIALIEGAAIVGDILSFYQQLYANEAFLRTARWRESVAELVKLTGYRLAPALGGHARFALAVKGDQPVSVPKGFGLKAQLDGAPKPAVFETSAPAKAYPHLNQFHLYRPRYAPAISNGADTFSIAAAPDAVTLKAGDRVLVGIVRPDGASLDHSQVLIVDKTWEFFGALLVKMKAGITSLRPRFPVIATAPIFAAVAAGGVGPVLPSKLATFSSSSVPVTSAFALASQVAQFSFSQVAPAVSLLGAALGISTVTAVGELRAYKLGGSFRHFGHNAPRTQIVVDANGRAQAVPVSYLRSVSTATHAPANPALADTHMPLDGEVDDVAAGMTMLVEANLSATGASGSPRKRVIERTIRAVDRQSLAWGPVSGASTVVTLDRALAVTEDGVSLNQADIRGMTFHQVEGTAFTLKAPLHATHAQKGAALDFYGTAAQVAALDQRTLLLAGPGTALAEGNVLAVDLGPSGDVENRIFRRVTLDREVAYQDFDHDQPAVTIFGNLVIATEGKTEDEVALGDGDGREIFQTFALPKPPLTYLLDPAHEPPHAPELAVYVGGRLWQRVDSLLERGPGEPVYIVREDADGKSFVQFGDGKTGARLPSGRGNVVARWRSGSGSSGPLKADAKPQPAGRLPGVDKVFMPEPATGGAASEGEDAARDAAPGRMQSLARLVSLADFEAEALAIAGVLKARAVWTIVEGTPHVVVTVLTQSRSAADAAAIADALSALYQARGPARYPLTVVPGKRQQLRIEATVGYDPTFREDDVRAAVLDAVGAASEGSERVHGLFSWQQRQFGQGAHGSQIVATMQNVSGVVWVRLTAIRRKNPSPAATLSRVGPVGAVLVARPAASTAMLWLNEAIWLPPPRRSIFCGDDSILALDEVDLTLSLIQVSEVS
jgi:hypothetical protein